MQTAFQNSKALFSFGVNLLLLLCVLFFLKPLFNSGDDTLIMYSFSGGFGVPPTELVDYSWGWHFLLGLSLKELFTVYPYINWYSVLLLSIHWFSCSLIFLYFLRSFRLLNALIFYAMFFVFFEITLLLSLNFTNTSIICAIAANVMVIEKLTRSGFNKSTLIVPFALLFVSGILRFHAWAFVEAVFVLFILFLQRKRSWTYVIFKGGLLIIIGLLYIVHQNYYKRKIPGWPQKERVSQLLISYYNGPRSERKYQGVFKDSIEAEFFYNSFFYDTLVLTEQRLKDIIPDLRGVRRLSSPVEKETIYWTFMNARLYLLALALPLFFLVFERRWNVLKKVLPFLVWSLLLYVYLYVFSKITEAVFMGFVIMNWLIFFLFSASNQSPVSKVTRAIFIPLFAFCFVWGFMRIYKINSANIENYSKWVCYRNELKRNSSTIHVTSSPDSHINYLSITDAPIKFSLTNFISVSQFAKTVYDEKKKELGLRNILEDMLSRSDLALTGPKLSSLKEYYLRKYRKEVALVDDSLHYRCAEVYKVVLK